MMLSWVCNDVYDPTPEGVAMRYDSVQTSGFIDCTICSHFQVVLHTVWGVGAVSAASRLQLRRGHAMPWQCVESWSVWRWFSVFFYRYGHQIEYGKRMLGPIRHRLRCSLRERYGL